MKKIRIREDNYINNNYEYAEMYKCEECDHKFKDRDIVLEIELYETYWRFCSEECLIKWILSVVEKKQIEVYPVPDRIKQRRVLLEKIENLKPNTTITIGELKVEYHKTDGLQEHYIVKNIMTKMFLYKHEVIDYILEQMQIKINLNLEKGD